MVSAARTALGYTAQADRNSKYGARVGHPNKDWSGAFLDVLAHEAGVDLPACVYPPNAMAQFFHVPRGAVRNRIRQRPARGDIVFLATPVSPGDPFAAPQVGLVVDTFDWDPDQMVTVIQGQAGTGHAQVVERSVYVSDIICFARPTYKTRAAGYTGETKGLPTVRPSHFVYGKRNSWVEIVQLALATTLTDVSELERGMFDEKTRSAYARWQRSLGLVGVQASGQPDTYSLGQLAARTGTFRA